MQPISSLPASIQAHSESPFKFASIPRPIFLRSVADFLSFKDVDFLFRASLLTHEEIYKHMAFHVLFSRSYNLSELELKDKHGAMLLNSILNVLPLNDIEKFRRTLSLKIIAAPIMFSRILSLGEERRVLSLLEIVTLRSAVNRIPAIENGLENILSKNAVTMALQERADIRGCLPVNLTSYSMLLNVIERKIQTTRNQQIDAIKRSDFILWIDKRGFEDCRRNQGYKRACALLMDIGYAALTLTFLALSISDYQSSDSIGVFGILFIIFAAFPSISMYSRLSGGLCIDGAASCEMLLIVLLATLFAYPITLGITAFSVYANCLILRIEHIENRVPSELSPQIMQWINNINVLGGQASEAECQRVEELGLPVEILRLIQMQPANPTCWNGVQNTVGAVIGRFSHFQPVSAESAELVLSPLNNV